MIYIENLIWWLPIIFIVHEFEEIIFMKIWLNLSKEKLVNKFPQFAPNIINHLEKISIEGFSLGVLEEFIIISIITITAVYFNFYLLWLGIFIAFTIHLIIHCIQLLLFRCYVVATVTSVISLPICIWIIKVILLKNNYIVAQVVIVSVISLVLMIINLLFIHRLMERFENWKIEKIYDVKKIL